MRQFWHVHFHGYRGRFQYLSVLYPVHITKNILLGYLRKLKLGYYCGPVFVMAASPLLFQERFTTQKTMSFLAVLIGIVFANSQAFYEPHTAFGIFCALMSAVVFALMIIFNKKAVEIKDLENPTIQLCGAFLSVFLFVIWKQGWQFSMVSSDIGPLIFLGLINTGVGGYLFFSTIGKIKVQTVAIVGYLEPLSAIVLSFVFLQETFQPLQILGAIFIIGGAIGAEFHFSKKAKETL